MATVTLTSAFDTDSFWFASANFISNSGTVYRYESAAGDFIEVTGTGLTESGGTPTGGTYTDIRVYPDNSFTPGTEIATYTSATAFNFATYFTNAAFDGLSLNDTITGSSGNDTIEGKGGTDTLNGGEGDDVYQFSSQFGSDVVGIEIINDSGFSGSDFIQIIGNLTVIDFSSATVLNIEELLFTDLQTAQFDQVQLPANLAVTGATASQAIIVNVTQPAFTAAGWSFTTWGVNDKVNIVGNSSNNIITGSSQEDFITGQGGDDSLDGGESGDTYQYGSTSEVQGDGINDSGANTDVDKLFLSGDVDFSQATSIANIEGLAFDGSDDFTATFDAGQFGTGLISSDFLVTGTNGTTQTVIVNNALNFSAVPWSLVTWEATDILIINGSNGGDTLTGSNQNDTINGGLGTDILRGGIGGDTLDGGEGSDIYDYGVSEVISGETITDTGTAGKDTIRLLGLGEVNFSAVTGGSLTGIEAFVFTGSQDLIINSFPIFGVNFELTGSNGTAQSFTVNNANGNFSIAGWTLKNWESSDHVILNGGGGTDEIIGSTRNDIIDGKGDEDTLIGGRGKDTLTGGTEKDTFDYNSVKDSAKGANRDIITDFSGFNVLAPDLDLIDLSTIDARTTRAGNQKFTFIGAQKFHDRAGELQVKYNATTETAIVSGDRNGDGRADFQIQVFSEAALAKLDFLL